jgi:CHASE2 domain-containing sensor protein
METHDARMGGQTAAALVAGVILVSVLLALVGGWAGLVGIGVVEAAALVYTVLRFT